MIKLLILITLITTIVVVMSIAFFTLVEGKVIKWMALKIKLLGTRLLLLQITGETAIDGAQSVGTHLTPTTLYSNIFTFFPSTTIISYIVLAIMIINTLWVIAFISSLRWVTSLLCAIAFYISLAYFLILTGVDFIGILYFIIYLGAIMTLFLFAVMFLHITNPEVTRRLDFWNNSLEKIGSIYKISSCLLLIFVILLKLIVRSFIYFIKNDEHSWNQILLTKNYLKKARKLLNEFLDFYNYSIISFCTYTSLFLIIVYLTQTFLINNSIFGIFSEQIFTYMGAPIQIISDLLYTDCELELTLVGLAFWISFICILILLSNNKNNK